MTLPNRIDVSSLVPIPQMRGDCEADTRLLESMAREAENFLKRFSWVKGIKEGHFGWGIGGVVAVFLFVIEAASPDVDDCLWVVVGDLPPACLVTDDASTPRHALECYIGEMDKWVAAVRGDQPVDHLIP